MSMFTSRSDFDSAVVPYVGGVNTASSLLNETQGILPNYTWAGQAVNTLVDRALYATTSGSGGEWAFGMFRTPQKWLVDTIHGWDPNVDMKRDPEWTPKNGQDYWNRLPLTDRASVLVMGGEELQKEIINGSVSERHFIQRVEELSVLAKTTSAIENYDKTHYIAQYGAKTSSALFNYVGTDPSLAVTLGYSAGLQALTAGEMAFGIGSEAATAARVAKTASYVPWEAGSVAARTSTAIGEHIATYARIYRTSTYLWDGVEGASAGYSSWHANKRAQERQQGVLGHYDDSWTKEVMWGAAMGLTVSAGLDMLFGGAKIVGPSGAKKVNIPGTLDELENSTAIGGGHLNTVADAVEGSRWNNAKSRLLNALDSTEGPDSEIRRLLANDDHRAFLGHGNTDEMDALAHWIETNKPNTAELESEITKKLKVRVENQARMAEWAPELDAHVAAGGDTKNFFRKKAHDFLRSFMKEDYEDNRWIIQHMEDNGYSPERIAEFMANGDKDRVLRYGRAANSAKAIADIEADAINAASAKVQARAMAHEADEAANVTRKIQDNVSQGRWQGAVDVLNDLHAETIDRAGRILSGIQESVDAINVEYNAMNRAAKRGMREHKNLMAAFDKLREATGKFRDGISAHRRNALAMMDSGSTADEVVIQAHSIMGIGQRGNATWSDEMFQAFKEVQEAKAAYDAAQARISRAQGLVRNLTADVNRLAGRRALDKTMRELKEFPLWKVELSEHAYDSVMRGVSRQVRNGNRWKVEFVDRFLGENAAQVATETGTNPMRPVLAARESIPKMTHAEQDAVLAAELAKAEPKIAAIEAGAADIDLGTKIARAKEASDSLNKLATDTEASLAARADRGASEASKSSVTKKLEELAANRRDLANRQAQKVIRLQKRLDFQLGKLNADVSVPETVTAESVEATRRNAAQLAHDELRARIEALSPEELASKKGRTLRNRAREAAAEIEGGTRFNKAARVARSLEEETTAAQAKVNDLISRGSLEGDPALKAARKELKYLEKKSNEIANEINSINNRPAAMRRMASLSGDSPAIADVERISRLRAAANVALEAGNDAEAHRLVVTIFNEFGDARRVPRWGALEEFFYKQAKARSLGQATDEIAHLSMDGRNVRIKIMAAKPADIGDQLNIGLAAQKLEAEQQAKLGMASPGSARGATSAERDLTSWLNDTAHERMLAQNPDVVTTEHVFAATEAVPVGTAEGTAVKTTAVGGTVTPETSRVAKVRKALEPTEAELKKKNKVDKILEVVGKNKEGERLVFASALAASMGRVPGLGRLGRLWLRAATAGTGFGATHNLARTLDLVVASYNMLDRPESLVKSIGFLRGVHRTFQHFKDESKGLVNELASVKNQALNSGDWTAASSARINAALDNGVAAGLNAGETNVYNILRRNYANAGELHEVVHPGSSIPNYRTRAINHELMVPRKNEAVADFSNAYHDRMMSGAEALPNEFADSVGIARGTRWTALDAATQTRLTPALRTHAEHQATESVARLLGNITEDGIGYRVAGRSGNPAGNRILENSVVADPRVSRWYIQDPTEAFKRYADVHLPRLRFEAQLSRMIGEPTTYDEVLRAMEQNASTVANLDLRTEMQQAINKLKAKWEFHSGRAEYKSSLLMDATEKIATGIIRGSAGAMFGMAGLVTEVPRAIFAAKQYGGSMHGIFDAMYALRQAHDIGMYEDIHHALDQFATHCHDAACGSIGYTAWDRIKAPWERWWAVTTGRQAAFVGGHDLPRFAGALTSFADAYGETGMRLGGMHYFAGVARIIADRQAKRFISRNLNNLINLSEGIRSLGEVAEQTAENTAAFRNVCRNANVPYDVAIKLNQHGVLHPEVIGQLRTAIQGEEEVFRMGAIRGRVDDRSFGALQGFLTEAHNHAVPVTSFATSVESRSAIEKMFYNLSSYSRAFALNVAYRGIANDRLASMASTYASVALGENIYQMSRNMSLGRKSIEDMEQEWQDNPTGFFFKNAIKSPWLGAHNSMAADAIGLGFGTNLTAGARGNSVFSPILQGASAFSRRLYSDKEMDDTDYNSLRAYAPLANTWYSGLMFNSFK